MKKVLNVYRSRGLRQLVSALLYDLLGRILLGIFNARYVRKRIFTYVMTLDLKDKGISRTLWLFGRRELDHKWLLEKTLKPDATVLDIGANIGYYALMEQHLVGSNGRIIAVEPSPENVELLRKNIKLNRVKNIEVIQGAVSKVQGQREFWLAEESNLNSFHRQYLIESGTLSESIMVDVTTIRQLVARHGKIDYVRMDIEGHEFEILQDIVNLAEESSSLPDIIFETHNRSYGSSRNIVAEIEKLFSVGYTIPYASSSSERGTRKLEAIGLPSLVRLRTDDTYRTIHENLSIDQLAQCLNRSGGIRTVFLKWHNQVG